MRLASKLGDDGRPSRTIAVYPVFPGFAARTPLGELAWARPLTGSTCQVPEYTGGQSPPTLLSPPLLRRSRPVFPAAAHATQHRRGASRPTRVRHGPPLNPFAPGTSRDYRRTRSAPRRRSRRTVPTTTIRSRPAAAAAKTGYSGETGGKTDDLGVAAAQLANPAQGPLPGSSGGSAAPERRCSIPDPERFVHRRSRQFFCLALATGAGAKRPEAISNGPQGQRLGAHTSRVLVPLRPDRTLTLPKRRGARPANP